jgi:hypothetical protein
VLCGPEIDIARALARRRAGQDVVVCSKDVDANRRQAFAIESSVGPCKRGEPHDLAGPHSAALSAASEAAGRTHVLRNRPAQSEEETMKYFTQDLIVRGQSQNDTELNEVEALWDENCARYAAYVDSVRDRLPPGLRHRIDSYYLHDAVVRGVGRKVNSFVIIVQLDTPPQSIVTFAYDLLSEPDIRKETPELCAGSVVDWQYDEIEMVPGDPPSWRQSILLSNGWELSFHFRDIAVEEVQAIIPPPKTGPAADTFVMTQPAQG